MTMKLNWLGIIVATVIAYFIGFLWYGVIFEAQWIELSGVSPEAGGSTTAMALGLVQTFVVMVGLGWLIGKLGEGWLNGARIGLMACVFFALMTMAYGFIYQTEPMGLLWIDASHLLAVYIVGGAVIGGLRLKPKA